MSRVSREYVHHAQVGQGLVSAALRLDAARRAQSPQVLVAERRFERRAPAADPAAGYRTALALSRLWVWNERITGGRPHDDVRAGTRIIVRPVDAAPDLRQAVVLPRWWQIHPYVHERYGGRYIFARGVFDDFGRFVLVDAQATTPDRVGQGSLVSSALRLDAARRAEALRRAELPLTPPSRFDPARARQPGEGGTLSVPDPSARRPRISTVEAAQRLSAALDRFGIPHGRVEVTHPLGVQIWSHPQGEHRPGTGIPLMTRVVVLPQGAILQVTPDPRIIEAALNSPEGFGMGFYSYHARWNLRDVDQRVSPATFERRGVPTAFLRGEGYIAGSMADRLLPLHRRGQTVPT